MNVEQAYIKYGNVEKIIAIIEQRLSGKLSDIVLPEQMIDFDSYNTLLAGNIKRKVALSGQKNGWITMIESKEVNDNAMLLYMSKELNTDVLSVIQSDVTGVLGFVEMSKGMVVDIYFSEDDEEIEDLMINKLKERAIEEPLYMFRDVVKNADWNIIQM